MSQFHAFFDCTGGLFWSLTYLLIALIGLNNKKEARLAIPIVSLTLNFAWEVASVIFSFLIENVSFTRAYIIRFAWFILDVFIIFAFYKKVNLFPKLRKFFCAFVLFCGIFSVFFYLIFINTENGVGMLLSSFAIDVHMAMMFFLLKNRLDPTARLYIGITKLLGDICAWLAYGYIHPAVLVIGAFSFLFNALYVIYAFKEERAHPEINDDFKEKVAFVTAKLTEIKKTYMKKLKIILIGEKQYHKKRKYKKKKKTKKTHRKK